MNITCHINHLDGLLLGFDGRDFVNFECGVDGDDDDSDDEIDADNNGLSQDFSDDEDDGKNRKKTRGENVLRECLSYGKNWCVFHALAYLSWHCEKWHHIAVLKQQGRKICKDSLGQYAKWRNDVHATRTKKLFEVFQERYPTMTENFIGVTFQMLPVIELTFNCRINLYTKTCAVRKNGTPGNGE